MKNILYYGLQRSGTNFLESILLRNYKISFLNSDQCRKSPLQKHCRLYEDKEIIPEPQYNNSIYVENLSEFESLFDVVPDYYLVISKDPYSWWLSYEKWAIKCQWPNVNHHYIEEYNLFYNKFIELALQSDKFIFIKYCDLLSNTDQVLLELSTRINIKKKLLSRVTIRRPNRVPQSASFTNARKLYYQNESYMKEYTKEKLNEINMNIDKSTISYLGYEIKNYRD